MEGREHMIVSTPKPGSLGVDKRFSQRNFNKELSDLRGSSLVQEESLGLVSINSSSTLEGQRQNAKNIEKYLSNNEMSTIEERLSLARKNAYKTLEDLPSRSYKFSESKTEQDYPISNATESTISDSHFLKDLTNNMTKDKSNLRQSYSILSKDLSQPVSGAGDSWTGERMSYSQELGELSKKFRNSEITLKDLKNRFSISHQSFGVSIDSEMFTSGDNAMEKVLAAELSWKKAKDVPGQTEKNTFSECSVGDVNKESMGEFFYKKNPGISWVFQQKSPEKDPPEPLYEPSYLSEAPQRESETFGTTRASFSYNSMGEKSVLSVSQIQEMIRNCDSSKFMDFLKEKPKQTNLNRKSTCSKYTEEFEPPEHSTFTEVGNHNHSEKPSIEMMGLTPIRNRKSCKSYNVDTPLITVNGSDILAKQKQNCECKSRARSPRKSNPKRDEHHMEMHKKKHEEPTKDEQNQNNESIHENTTARIPMPSIKKAHYENKKSPVHVRETRMHLMEEWKNKSRKGERSPIKDLREFYENDNKIETSHTNRLQGEFYENPVQYGENTPRKPKTKLLMQEDPKRKSRLSKGPIENDRDKFKMTENIPDSKKTELVPKTDNVKAISPSENNVLYVRNAKPLANSSPKKFILTASSTNNHISPSNLESMKSCSSSKDVFGSLTKISPSLGENNKENVEVIPRKLLTPELDGDKSFCSVRSGSCVDVQIDGKIPISSTKNELVFGCVKVGKTASQNFLIKSKCSDRKIRFQITATGSAFKISKNDTEYNSSYTIILHPLETKTITVAFSPITNGPFIEKLNIANVGYDEKPKQSIRMYGYGGQALIETRNITKDLTGKAILPLGSLNNRHYISTRFHVQNNGSIPSFTFIKFNPKYQYKCSVQVFPSKFVLQPNEEAEVQVHYKPSKEDFNGKILQEVLEIGALLLVTGDEPSRLRLRRLCKKAKQHNIEVLELTQQISTNFEFETPLEMAKFTETLGAMKDLQQLINYKEVILTLEQNLDRTEIAIEDETTFFDTIFMNNSNTTLDNTVLQKNTNILNINPVSIILTPPVKMTDVIFLLNCSDANLDFQITNFPSCVSVFPTEGVIAPKDEIIITISFNENGGFSEEFSLQILFNDEKAEINVKIKCLTSTTCNK